MGRLQLCGCTRTLNLVRLCIFMNGSVGTPESKRSSAVVNGYSESIGVFRVTVHVSRCDSDPDFGAGNVGKSKRPGPLRDKGHPTVRRKKTEFGLFRVCRTS
jgi:hypothetical protein